MRSERKETCTDMIDLRAATAADAETLAYIQTESWKAAFAGILSGEVLARYTDLEATEAMYRRVLCKPEIHITLESVAGRPHCIAAWSKSRQALGQGVAELICIHSLPERWGRGYGSQMMRHVLSEIVTQGYSEVVLWVFEENLRARAFYERNGFAATENRQNSFGAAEIMYARKL